MVILEDVVCGAVELYCITQRDVSVTKPTLIDINGVYKKIKTPIHVRIAQYN